jgi:hypothetical protein
LDLGHWLVHVRVHNMYVLCSTALISITARALYRVIYIYILYIASYPHLGKYRRYFCFHKWQMPYKFFNYKRKGPKDGGETGEKEGHSKLHSVAFNATNRINCLFVPNQRAPQPPSTP